MKRTSQLFKVVREDNCTTRLCCQTPLCWLCFRCVESKTLKHYMNTTRGARTAHLFITGEDAGGEVSGLLALECESTPLSEPQWPTFGCFFLCSRQTDVTKYLNDSSQISCIDWQTHHRDWLVHRCQIFPLFSFFFGDFCFSVFVGRVLFSSSAQCSLEPGRNISISKQRFSL